MTTLQKERVPWGTQFRALFLKNLTMQSRQRATTILQLIIPLGLICLIGGVQVLIDNVLETDPLSLETYGRLNVSETIPLNALGNPHYPDLLYGFPFFWMSAPTGIEAELGQCTYDGQQSGMLGHVPQEIYGLFLDAPSPFNTSLPFFEAKDTPDEVNEALIDVYRLWELMLNEEGYGYSQREILNTTTTWIADRDFDNVLPYGAVLFDGLSGASASLAYTAMGASRFGGLALYPADTNQNLSFIQAMFPDIDRRGNIINVVHNAFFSYLQSVAPLPSSNETYSIETFYQGMPFLPEISMDLASVAGVFTYGFCASLLFPVFIANIVTDKQERVLLMMRLSGMRMSIYWTVTYIFDLVLYIMITIVIFASSLAFSMRLFTQTSWLLLFIFFMLWGNALIGCCFVMATFFSRSRTASVVGYLLVIIAVGISNVCNSAIFLRDSPPAIYMMFPPFAFYRVIFLMEDACISLSCFQLEDLTTNDQLTSAAWYLLIEGIVLFPLAGYLYAVLPNEFGIRRSPFFCFEPIVAFFRKKAEGDTDNAEERLVENKNNDVKLSLRPSYGSISADMLGMIEDEDVVEERRKVLEKTYDPSCPLVIRNMRKEYPGRYGQPPKMAVRGVSFAIAENECFGLLGANGAGKTTLISMITGAFAATSGGATLAGHDTETEIELVQREIGVCPQFDVFYPDLTTAEHLYFYARLKGATRKNEADIVVECLDAVALKDQGDKLAKNLSGGMRRRLSLAIAIIGRPRIVILDEPTTGLDPLTRRQIWEILEDLKAGRSMILTTHSMEEADILCNRIGIMSKGRLKGIGAQERLKAKYGSGYALTLFVEPDHEAETKAFVQSLIPGAELLESISGMMSFRVDKDKLVISRVLRGFQQAKPSWINDWGISMTTLEDVFVNIVKADEINEEPPPKE